MADASGAVLLTPDLREIAARAATEAVEKALRLPAGATTVDLGPAARAVAENSNQQVANVAPYPPLPRTQPLPIFGPGRPLDPSGLDPALPGRLRPAPRISDFPTSVNINIHDRLVPFSLLRDVSENVDVIRRCIEVRKAHLTALKWDFVVSDRAVERLMAEKQITSPGEAAQVARDLYAPQIAEAVEFWKCPDRGQGYEFVQWLDMLLEQHLVYDAVSIYPHPTRDSSEVHSFELVDGSTIKPLLDYRGAVPAPPDPAYQQILKGFPRGEFTASLGATNEFTSDTLVYRPRNRRVGVSPYGYSNVEQALSAADLYLKRMTWVRTEFTDGVMPTALFKTDIPWAEGAEQLVAYEQVFNDELAGLSAERHRARLLPKGFDIAKQDEWAEKYKSDYDEFLIKLLCMCFTVAPPDIGFAEKGVRATGEGPGIETSTYRKAIRPDVVWLNGIVNHLEHTFRGTSPDVEFTFIGYEVEDQYQLAQQEDLLVRGGQHTLNQARASRGEPLYDFPEADQPMIVNPTGVTFISGSLAAAQQARDAAAAGVGAQPTDGAVDAPGGQLGTTKPPTTPADPAPTAPVPASNPGAEVAKIVAEELRKYNENHDELGRFAESDSSGGGGGPVTTGDLTEEEGRAIASSAMAHANGKITSAQHKENMRAILQGAAARTGKDVPAKYKALMAEGAKFVRYTEKRVGRTWRDFTFDTVDPATAGHLNELGAAGDVAGVKAVVALLGKELAGV
ncbi:MAG TPA: hypothetical protein VMT43_11615 [Acidimicrobiales bacterium]|nr:hypothetical protein [Acidimicrobiales bacterium]